MCVECIFRLHSATQVLTNEYIYWNVYLTIWKQCTWYSTFKYSVQYLDTNFCNRLIFIFVYIHSCTQFWKLNIRKSRLVSYLNLEHSTFESKKFSWNKINDNVSFFPISQALRTNETSRENSHDTKANE